MWGWLVARTQRLLWPSRCFLTINGRTPSRPRCLKTLGWSPTGLESTLPALHWGTRPRGRFQTGSQRLWEGWCRARSVLERRSSLHRLQGFYVLLGNGVFCRAWSLWLLDGGLHFPSALGSLCAKRLRSVAVNAAIKACFAAGLMLGSVVEWPVRPSCSRIAGRWRPPSDRFLLPRLPRGSPRVFPPGLAGCDPKYEQFRTSRDQRNGAWPPSSLPPRSPQDATPEGSRWGPGVGRQVGWDEWSGYWRHSRLQPPGGAAPAARGFGVLSLARPELAVGTP